MRPPNRTSSSQRRRRSGAAAVATVAAITLAAVGLNACASPPTAREAAVGDSAGCAPVFPKAAVGNQQYYRVSMQFFGCLPMDIPLNVDVGAPAGTGAPLSSAPQGSGPGSNVPGADVLWDAGDGKGVVPAQTTIPKGNATGTAAGGMVGFSSVPYWDKEIPEFQGPCANSSFYADGSGTVNQNDPCEVIQGSGNPGQVIKSDADFKGEWALYLPTATLEAAVVQQPVPFPFVSTYFQATGQKPGAIATGMALVRKQMSGQMLPIYTRGTPAYQGGPPQSPQSQYFNSAGCFDNLVVEDGANHNPSLPGNWSTMIKDGINHSYLTTVIDTLDSPGDLAQTPILYFTKGWLDTLNASISTIPLNTPTNSPLARQQHTFQGYLRYLTGTTCGGPNETIPLGMIGGQAADLEVGGSTLVNPIVANSTIAYSNLQQVVANAPEKGYSVFGFGNFRTGNDSDGNINTGSNWSGVSLAGADLTGATFPQATFGNASFQGATLYYTDLSTTDAVTSANFANDLECHTNLGPQGGGYSYNNCQRMPGQASWSGAPVQQCTPASCVFVSIYNNTTRYLNQGLMSCQYGKQAGGSYSAPQVLGSLDTAQFGFVSNGGDTRGKEVTCSATYTNGPWGKIQVRADNTSGSWKTAVDSGYCAARQQGSGTDPCLPKAAPEKLPVQPQGTPPVFDPTKEALYPAARQDGDGNPVPVKVSSSSQTNTAMGITTIDVILCEPEAVDTNSNCKNSPALPAYADEAPSAGQLATAPVKTPFALPADYTAYQAVPRDSGLPASIAGSATHALQYTVKQQDNDVASVYLASDVDLDAVNRVMSGLKKYDAAGIQTLKIAGGNEAIAWPQAGGFRAMTISGSTYVAVSAQNIRQIKKLSSAFAVSSSADARRQKR